MPPRAPPHRPRSAICVAVGSGYHSLRYSPPQVPAYGPRVGGPLSTADKGTDGTGRATRILVSPVRWPSVSLVCR